MDDIWTNMWWKPIIDHVFLPRQLPGKQSDTLLEDEGHLLHYLTTSLTVSEYSHLVPTPVKTLFASWSKLQGLNIPTPEGVSAALKRLKPGEMFGYFVRAQNCGLFFSSEKPTTFRQSPAHLTMCTFPASLPNSTIMSSDSEVAGAYPEQAISVPYSELLTSHAIASQIVTLTNQEMLDALQTSSKAGSKPVEVREPADTLYISELLVGILSNSGSKANSTFPTVCKKVRDNVQFENALIPFRRSGLWMTAKVILQLALVKSMGDKDGTLFYKILMNEFMRKICEDFGQLRDVNSDLGMHMIKKLARRMRKIKKMNCNQAHKAVVEQLHGRVTQTVLDLKGVMDKNWRKIIKAMDDVAKLPLLEVCADDIIHTKLPLVPSFQTVTGSNTAYDANTAPKCLPRLRLSLNSEPFNVKFLIQNQAGESLGNLLFDIESWILSTNIDTWPCEDLKTLAFDYIGTATKFYKATEDPIGGSRMILALLKIIRIMDGVATRKYPLLLEHRSCIETSIINYLLLLSKSELEVAQEIQEWFQKRDKNATLPGLIEEDAVTSNSFSARYAETNKEMCDLRTKILYDAEEEIKTKKGELLGARNFLVELRSEYRGLRCIGGSTQDHVDRCANCKLKQVIDSKKVPVYERPLRSELYNQYAAVFELQAPKEITCLRDVMILLLKEVCQAKEKKYIIENRIWTRYFQLSKYMKVAERIFKLGSTIKLFVDSHYKEAHPDNSDDSFIVNNGYNCTFAGNYEKTWKVKNWCTLKIDPASPYSCLQWTLETTKHFPNEVSARLCQCPHNIRLGEYKAFGSLRAGHRLQLRNILHAFVSKTLSLKEESVFTLICQSAWETGPENQCWYRDSHTDLADPAFAEELLQHLTILLNTYEKNWTEAYTLLTVIVLGCRILEFGQINDAASSFLLKCRDTACQWIRDIEEAKSKEKSEVGVRNLQLKLVDAAICLCWTYAVGSEYINLVLNSERDVADWIFGMSRIYNVINTSSMSLSQNRTIMIRKIRNVALSIETKLIKFVNPGLSTFVKNTWNDGRFGTFEEWTSYPAPAQQVYKTTFTSNTSLTSQIKALFSTKEVSVSSSVLQVDIIRGSFLINGFPVGYLPENVTKNAVFERTFRNVVFEVLPAVESRTFVTKHEYNGAVYHFRLIGDTDVIVQERKNELQFQLIPKHLLGRKVPHLLVEKYSHWLNILTNCIEFRPVYFEDFVKHPPKYSLNCTKKVLEEISTGRKIFFVDSDSQESVNSYLSRLEHPDFIIILLDKLGQVFVDLPPQNLHFQLDERNHRLISLEYNMNVCHEQGFKTLIGLQNGLMLENEFEETKLLIPHETVFISKNTGHQKVSITLTQLNEPPIFTFDLDRTLQVIKAGKSRTAWLYLAYLHGVTSSPLADPFTGLTGTEAAFQILQSGQCWSCQPYQDKECLQILDRIEKLAPVRKFYPPKMKNMEVVRWPTGLPTYACADGYTFIVNKLITDSERLKEIFKTAVEDDTDDEDEEENTTNNFLYKRAYFRYNSLNSFEGSVSEEFCPVLPAALKPNVGVNGKILKTDSTRISNVRHLSDLGKSWKHDKHSTPLRQYLVNQYSLDGLSDPTALTQMSIVELLEIDLRNNWINLYELARNVKKLKLECEWTIVLAILAWKGHDVNQLLLLQSVAVQRVYFQSQHPPVDNDQKDIPVYTTPIKNEFYNVVVQTTFRTLAKLHGTTSQIFANILKHMWPIESCCRDNFEDLIPTNVSSLNLNFALEAINSKMLNWTRNHKLDLFLNKILLTIPDLPLSDPVHITAFAQKDNTSIMSLFCSRPKFKNSESNGICSAELFKITPTSLLNRLVHVKLSTVLRTPQERAFMFKKDPKYRLKPVMGTSDYALHNFICALGVVWTVQQQAKRCIKFYKLGEVGRVHLMREMENPGHENWSPAEYPLWLMFEIEMNLMIRKVQVDVANQMIKPQFPESKLDGKHCVMQLNMGEGKTAVIVPLLALALANGVQMFRVTVLKSLFKTNLASLILNLGGLLNRRLYIFPCRRDLNITTDTADTILDLYKECMAKKGIVLTLPEHRLSFQLKGYEKSRANKIDEAESLIRVHKWLADNARDVLDESDEVLYAKYQLIYTLGSQLPVDGGSLRWIVAQNLLKLVPARMNQLKDKFGETFVDAPSNLDYEPESFRHSRILKRECYDQLINWLAEDVLGGKCPGLKLVELLPDDHRMVLEILTNTAIEKTTHDRALTLFTSVKKDIFLILMGYLKYEILYLVLSKRWRVNYGVDPEGERKMAVPFRAKDIPAKRTEFGHPDVAILLTQLAYYYSGLSDEEIKECFKRLSMHVNKEEEYGSWIRLLGDGRVDPSIRDYNGVNLSNQNQKLNILFPALRRNMGIVDFYLSNVVFAKECRVFEKKLICTPWDLCGTEIQHPVTGFSGTNDSCHLLPLTISQEDLPQLQDTNEKMRDTILSKENDNYAVLPRGITGKEIITKVIGAGAQVLLDPGALMLELSNEQVAVEWLQQLIKNGDKRKKAAVYFDDTDTLRVKHKDHLETSDPYDLSPYREKMESCVIYLDDVHTRGTDLKIPPPSKACVTLCAGITRDKLVQACMRMRLLGKGHTIAFFASDEAGDGIQSKVSKKTGSQAVMDWVCQNSRNFEKDVLVYWAASGINYAKNRAMVTFFELPNFILTTDEAKTRDYLALGERCSDDEVFGLMEMYGEHREDVLLTKILESQIERKLEKVKCHTGERISSIFQKFCGQIIFRCRELIKDKRVISHLLDEEQEKEHEEEAEEEREICRPVPATPATHQLFPHVTFFVVTGNVMPGIQAKVIVRLHSSLEKTKLWDIFKDHDWCSSQLYVTRDFVNVIIQDSVADRVDEFMRTPMWIITGDNGKTLVLISPFEANELIPVVRQKAADGIGLRMFSARLIPNQETLINVKKLIMSKTRVGFAEVQNHLLAPLYVFSGTLYFDGNEEQDHYCYFTGLIPRERTAKEQTAFKDGKITNNGFLLPSFRSEISKRIEKYCNFKEHPEPLIRGIIETRFGSFPQASHVSKLVCGSRRVEQFDK